MMIFLHRHPGRLREPTYLLTAQQLLEIANTENHRVFCNHFCEITFDFTMTLCRHEDMRYLDELLLVGHQMQNISCMLSSLRQTFVRRHHLNNWHRLRDHAYARILREEGEASAQRRLCGLFGEVNNVAGALRKYVPYFNWQSRISRAARY
jgi:hypothetical protein|uniref:Uncharacterized protein n=1 Tax=Myoviridae sp. ctshb19 TaxID=2825194 RepID=A0A8S5UGU2_9CAUD|nr:MAG TPA: hypothetical protein [Myoviridae sp. ctshb19]